MYMPGLSRYCAVGNLDFHRRRPRRGIEDRRHARDAAVEFLTGIRVDFHDGRVAGIDRPQILLDDVGDQAHRGDVHDRRDGGFCETNAPGSTLRLATKPSTGETTLVLPRLIRSSCSRAPTGRPCAPRQIQRGDAPTYSALPHRRALLRRAIAGRTGCAIARRWSARDSGRLRCGGRSPRRPCATPRPGEPARRSRGLRSCAITWPAPHAITELHADRHADGRRSWVRLRRSPRR